MNKVTPGHISCLVHNLFNVSLPNHNFEFGNYKKWEGSNAKLNDEVKFTITVVDLRSNHNIPYIEGKIDEIR